MMKRLKTAAAIVVLAGFVVGLAVFWRAPGTNLPDLLPGEERQLARVLEACRSGRLDEISYGHTEAVVQIGGRAVPHIAAELARWRAGRPEARTARGAILVDILYRLVRRLPPQDPGRDGGLDAICLCLRPDYRSASLEHDRKVAAAALAALGTIERLPALHELLEGLQARGATANDNAANERLSDYLRQAIASLDSDERPAPPPSLCWLPLPDGTWKRGFNDPLAR